MPSPEPKIDINSIQKHVFTPEYSLAPVGFSDRYLSSLTMSVAIIVRVTTAAAFKNSKVPVTKPHLLIARCAYEQLRSISRHPMAGLVSTPRRKHQPTARSSHHKSEALASHRGTEVARLIGANR